MTREKIRCSVLNSHFNNPNYSSSSGARGVSAQEVEVFIDFEHDDEGAEPLAVMCDAYDSEKKECKYKQVDIANKRRQENDVRCIFSEWGEFE